MNAPLITVIIATYNRAALLGRAIHSVQAQTYPHVVICVYDNASADTTPAIVRELAQRDPRIRYHRHERNIGAAQNFLYGLQRVETPLFFFLSDDDVVLPGFFADAVSWLERFPNARFAAGGTLEMMEGGELLFAPQAHWPRDGYFVPPDGLDLMLTGFHPSWNTIVFRREVLDEVGEFNSEIPNVSDLDFTLRIACRYPYVLFRKPSGIFVRHDNSGTEFANVSVIAQYETMMNGLTSAAGITDQVKSLIRVKLSEQLSKRILQIAIKQLLRMEPDCALDTLCTYHERYPRTALSTAVSAVAAGGAAWQPLIRALQPLERLRRAIRGRISKLAAQANGVERIDVSRYGAYLK